ncbi:MAG TPA: hypothetical protein ENJ95_17645 [Bacteroidetes bacterium]|nr:hypothetical protein [Bacteroidota bacterium]
MTTFNFADFQVFIKLASDMFFLKWLFGAGSKFPFLYFHQHPKRPPLWDAGKKRKTGATKNARPESPAGHFYHRAIVQIKRSK